MVVNGRTWPYLTVEQRRYRFRLLNACNSRFLILKMSRSGFAVLADRRRRRVPAGAGVAHAGACSRPRERADVIVDFTSVPVKGRKIVLLNLGPDEPFGGGVPGVGLRQRRILDRPAW